MNKPFIAIIVSILFCNSIFAQSQPPYTSNQNKVWAMSYHYGLDFSSGSPVVFNTELWSHEGIATACDVNGDLLFYCSSDTVWNRNHQVMPNGFDIGNTSGPYPGGISCTQGAVIVPVASSSVQYYIFSLSNIDNDTPRAADLSYSIVDMSLNGGLGDVLPQAKSVFIDSALSEKLTVIAGGYCDYWLLAHDREDAIFKAYHIDANGVSLTPVISNVGGLTGFHAYDRGVIKASQDGQKIAMCNMHSTTEMLGWGEDGIGLELFDFDNTTGIVSNSKIIDSSMRYYGACFSPSGSMLYAYGVGIDIFDTTFLVQYDLSYSDPADIYNSAYPIKIAVGHGGCGDLKLAVDSSIYLISYRQVLPYTLARIEYPDQYGVACEYVDSILTLPNYDNYGAWAGMPADFVVAPCESSVKKAATNALALNIFPNPATDHINIKGTLGAVSLSVYDISGRLLIERDVILKDTPTTVDINLQPGLYMVEVTGDAGKYVQKLLIQ